MDSDSDSNHRYLTRSKAAALESNVEFSIEKVSKKGKSGKSGKCGKSGKRGKSGNQPPKARILKSKKMKEGTGEVGVTMDDLSKSLIHRVFNELKQDLVKCKKKEKRAFNSGNFLKKWLVKIDEMNSSIPSEDDISKMDNESQTAFAGVLIINRMLKDILSNTMDRVAKEGEQFNLAKYIDNQLKQHEGRRNFIEEARQKILEEEKSAEESGDFIKKRNERGAIKRGRDHGSGVRSKSPVTANKLPSAKRLRGDEAVSDRGDDDSDEESVAPVVSLKSFLVKDNVDSDSDSDSDKDPISSVRSRMRKPFVKSKDDSDNSDIDLEEDSDIEEEEDEDSDSDDSFIVPDCEAEEEESEWDADSDAESDDVEPENEKQAIKNSVDKKLKKTDDLYSKFCDIMMKGSSSEFGNTLDQFQTLSEDEKKKVIGSLEKFDEMNDTDNPIYFKLIDSGMSDKQKAYVYKKMQYMKSMKSDNDEYIKQKALVDTIMKIPFGKKKLIDIEKDDKGGAAKFFKEMKQNMDDRVYGHQKGKQRIMEIIAKRIRNGGDGKGMIFGFEGPPGVGKTELMMSLSESLGLPFHTVALGGARDSSFMEGHDSTWVGSHQGEIVDILTRSEYINPVIYFDEIDKIGESAAGSELSNSLVHILDFTQNNKFHDKYIGTEFDIDLSGCTFICSFNDRDKIDRILLDRMEIIEVEPYVEGEKLKIARDYLYPRMCKDLGLDVGMIKFKKSALREIISKYTLEGGVRKLKEKMTNILMEVGFKKLVGDMSENKVMSIGIDYVKEFMNKNNEQPLLFDKPDTVDRVGRGYGLSVYVGLGKGALSLINVGFYPSGEKLAIMQTGSVGDMKKESFEIARTVAWNVIPKEDRHRLNAKWKKTGTEGIHIHAHPISEPIDGPSAGAMTVVTIVSRLMDMKIRNDVCMTGEIDMNGRVTAIGGLREKTEAARAAGMKLVLYPQQNDPDMVKVRESKFSVFKDVDEREFSARVVRDIWDALRTCLVGGEDVEWEHFMDE